MRRSLRRPFRQLIYAHPARRERHTESVGCKLMNDERELMGCACIDNDVATRDIHGIGKILAELALEDFPKRRTLPGCARKDSVSAREGLEAASDDLLCLCDALPVRQTLTYDR